MKYFADLMAMSENEVKAYAMEHPQSKAAKNALSAHERIRKAKNKLIRIGKREATVNGMTKNRYSEYAKKHCFNQ